MKMESPVTPAMNLSIAVVGGGAWGTALANVIAANRGGERKVLLWAREEAVVERINAARENSLFLPGIPLCASLCASADITDAASADVILLASPAQHFRQVALAVKAALAAGNRGVPVLGVCAKGIEEGGLHLMSEVLEQVFGAAVAPVILSGPTLAGEVARGLPTALVVACEEEGKARMVMEIIHGATLRPYLSNDVLGVQLGGALKNIFAIVCGIVAGRQLGENAHAAVLARGFAEMMNCGTALGARRETLMGLSGLGDLVLTCNARSSRNMSLGMALGRGESLADILARRRSVSEGVFTARAARDLGRKLGVEMPITETLVHILDGDIGVDAGMERLLARPLRRE